MKHKVNFNLNNMNLLNCKSTIYLNITRIKICTHLLNSITLTTTPVPFYSNRCFRCMISTNYLYKRIRKSVSI